MLKINLLGKVGKNPIVRKPSKKKTEKSWKLRKIAPAPRKRKPLRRVTLCGCGHHPVNPKKDVYKQHNIWIAQQKEKIEKGGSEIHSVKGVGISKSK